MKRIRIIFAALLFAAVGATAQINSPYSMYGYGIIADRATSMQRQMGGVGYAMNSGRQINVMNPASYAAIDSLTFLFDLGASFSPQWSKENTKDGVVRQTSYGGGVDYITMQFPLGKNFGGSIGMVPYSRVGYAFGNEIVNGTRTNSGTGGINELYAGFSGKFHGLSAGVNINYGFGQLANTVYASPSTGGQSKFEHVLRVRDWRYTAGVQYTARPSRFSKVVVGATFSPRSSMHGTTWGTQLESQAGSVPDTIAGPVDLKNSYYNPASFGGGMSYTYEKTSRIMVEGDFTLQKWSDAPYQTLYVNSDKKAVLAPGMEFYDRLKYAVGGEYIPNIRGNYLQRITYRAGAYFVDDYLRIRANNTDNRMKEYGLTCGFGFPTPEGKTMVNLGVEWKKRFTAPTNLLTENYLNVTLGINFNEVWFWQRKIR